MLSIFQRDRRSSPQVLSLGKIARFNSLSHIGLFWSTSLTFLNTTRNNHVTTFRTNLGIGFVEPTLIRAKTVMIFSEMLTNMVSMSPSCATTHIGARKQAHTHRRWHVVGLRTTTRITTLTIPYSIFPHTHT